MDFRVGDKVRVIKAEATEKKEYGFTKDYSKVGWTGRIKNKTEWGKGINKEWVMEWDEWCKVKYGNLIREWQLELIERGTPMSKYDEIKSRIESITESTSIKEVDDIVEELKIKGEQCVFEFFFNTKYILVRTKGQSFIFNYTDQCSKLTALKDALLWLLDHSDLPKEEEIKEGDYVVALDPKYFDEKIPDIKVGDIFKPYKIQDRYVYLDSYSRRNCFKTSVRKATPREVERYLKSAKKEEIEKIKEDMKSLQERLRRLEG